MKGKKINFNCPVCDDDSLYLTGDIAFKDISLFRPDDDKVPENWQINQEIELLDTMKINKVKNIKLICMNNCGYERKI